MSRFLMVDIGAGTMDVLWYDSRIDLHYKAVVGSGNNTQVSSLFMRYRPAHMCIANTLILHNSGRVCSILLVASCS